MTGPSEEDQKAADAVAAAIAILPETISLDNEEDVKAARAAYDALSEMQKSLVPKETRDNLIAAETAIAQWKQFNADVVKARAAATKLTSVSNKKKRTATITWRVSTDASGYQIWCSTSKNFKKGLKKVTVKNSATSSLKLKKLKKGKTYYIKIRPYTEVNNAATDNTTTVNGVWSAKKTIRIRK